MQYRTLGRTGLVCSPSAWAGWRSGTCTGRSARARPSACVRRAIDLGVNLIDTSPYYGQTRSETVLGEILSAGLPDKVYLCSKAGRNKFADFDFVAGRHGAERGSVIEALAVPTTWTS